MVMLVDVAKNNLIENSDGNPENGGYSYMKATKDIANAKVQKSLVKSANVAYAKVENDILTQEKIIEKALIFFRDNYSKVAGRKAG